MSDDSTGRGATILVVDDEPHMVELLYSVLSKAGHNVLSASCGKAALDTALECVPDLILMDISMPDMDGYEATVRIKRHEKLQNIPIIFLSGRSEEEDGGRSFALGAAMFLRKPFKINQIRDVVNLALHSLPRFQRLTASSRTR
jgi:CheY-like chemotaxis protein